MSMRGPLAPGPAGPVPPSVVPPARLPTPAQLLDARQLAAAPLPRSRSAGLVEPWRVGDVTGRDLRPPRQPPVRAAV